MKVQGALPEPPPAPTMTEQFSRACIDVKIVSDDQIKQWTDKPNLLTPTTPDFVRHLPWNNLNSTQVGRDIHTNRNTDSFWIIHVLGAYNPREPKGDVPKDYDHGWTVGNIEVGQATPVSALIYNETIRDIISIRLIGNKVWVSIPEAMARVMFHEVLHYFLGKHSNDLTDMTNRGIMNKYEISSNFYLCTDGIYALDEGQLKKIQDTARPIQNG